MEKTVRIKEWTRSTTRWSAVSVLILLCPLSVLAQAGDIFLGTRAADGTWSNFSDILNETGRPSSFQDVSMSATGEWLHMVAQTVDAGGWPPGGHLWYTIRVPGRWRFIFDQWVYFPPHWEPFTNVEAQAGDDPGNFVKASISANTSSGELHLVAVANTPYLESYERWVWHVIRRADGTWSQWSLLNLPAPASNVSISANSATGELHIVSTTSDGRLWHTIRRPDGTLSLRGPISAPYPGAAFSNVSIAANSATGELHVAGATSDGNLWYAIRGADGAWLSFTSLPGSAGPYYLNVSITSDPGSGELRVMSYDRGGGLWHAVRQANGTWLPFEFVPYGVRPLCETPALASALTAGPILNVATTTADPCIP